MVTTSVTETIDTATTPPSATPSGWRRFVTVRPACDVLPLLPPDQLKELAEVIRRNGLLEKIQMMGAGVNGLSGSPKDAVLIDGRNRLDPLSSSVARSSMPRPATGTRTSEAMSAAAPCSRSGARAASITTTSCAP